MTTGLIGKSGKYYKCQRSMHIPTAMENKSDAPFVFVYFNDPIAPIVMAEVEPTQKQIETIFELCTQAGFLFEDVTPHSVFDKFKGD